MCSLEWEIHIRSVQTLLGHLLIYLPSYEKRSLRVNIKTSLTMISSWKEYSVSTKNSIKPVKDGRNYISECTGNTPNTLNESSSEWTPPQDVCILPLSGSEVLFLWIFHRLPRPWDSVKELVRNWILKAFTILLSKTSKNLISLILGQIYV